MGGGRCCGCSISGCQPGPNLRGGKLLPPTNTTSTWTTCFQIRNYQDTTRPGAGYTVLYHSAGYGHGGQRPAVRLLPLSLPPGRRAPVEPPVVKSLGAVNLLYASSIDTSVQTKTGWKNGAAAVLPQHLPSVQLIPVEMNFEFLRYDLDPTKFDQAFWRWRTLRAFSRPYAKPVTASMLDGLNQLGLEFRTPKRTHADDRRFGWRCGKK